MDYVFVVRIYRGDTAQKVVKSERNGTRIKAKRLKMKNFIGKTLILVTALVFSGCMVVVGDVIVKCKKCNSEQKCSKSEKCRQDEQKYEDWYE